MRFVVMGMSLTLHQGKISTRPDHGILQASTWALLVFSEDKLGS